MMAEGDVIDWLRYGVDFRSALHIIHSRPVGARDSDRKQEQQIGTAANVCVWLNSYELEIPQPLDLNLDTRARGGKVL